MLEQYCRLGDCPTQSGVLLTELSPENLMAQTAPWHGGRLPDAAAEREGERRKNKKQRYCFNIGAGLFLRAWCCKHVVTPRTFASAWTCDASGGELPGGCLGAGAGGAQNAREELQRGEAFLFFWFCFSEVLSQ